MTDDLQQVLAKGIALYFDTDNNGLSILRSENNEVMLFIDPTAFDLIDPD